MKIDIKTKFLLHHDPKINLNRMKSKPYTPEHIGQYNVNCLIQTLSLRYLPVNVVCSTHNLSVEFDREITKADLEYIVMDLKNCVILDSDQFVQVEPDSNLWVTIC